MKNLTDIIGRFDIEGSIAEVKPLGNGLINDTYLVRTQSDDTPDYVLQRINHHVFTNVDVLQHNIETVTSHIRRKLEAAGETDIERKVLTPVAVKDSPATYHFDGEDFWRLMVYIPRSRTLEAITPESSRTAGLAFGRFQAMLADLDETLEETIPDFHNMELRIRQLRDAIAADPKGRVKEVRPLIDEMEDRAEEMCRAERLHREGKLPKRICHCDTKVNNMLFDEDGKRVLCVIDLDTVMPSYIFSDYGDFLRTAANTGAEDDPNLDNVEFDMDIFRAFTKGYLASAGKFLLPIEIENLPYAATLFPYMQAVRFLTDHINGDTYYKILYPGHNLVRTRAQLKLLHSAESKLSAMHSFIESLTTK